MKYVEGASVDAPLTIEYVCKEGYTLLYEGNFVYTCQDSGDWDNSNVPQCVNGNFLLLGLYQKPTILLFSYAGKCFVRNIKPYCFYITECFKFQKSASLHDYKNALAFCQNEFNGTLLQHSLMLKWKPYHELVVR